MMMGFWADVADDRALPQRLRESAKDLSVTFVVNAPRREILTCLAAAKLFWHTAALGELLTTAPQGMEHFGIATVEAMRVGCVPLVPTGGR